ncbi:hypothetical protein ACP2W0_19320 [Pseudobacillus badius]|uniref:hypothetical protein n=1 Tax=Bacillus badius TaxID=1455 RepID=UPI003CFA0200
MEKKKHIFTSKDGVEYELTVVEDIIKLNRGQLELIEEKIQQLNSNDIESPSGIAIKAIETEQVFKITGLITELLSEYSSTQEILDSEIVDFTEHATERMNDSEVCINRDWDYEEVEHEIVECLRKSYNVEQIRLRFDPETKESYRHFGFRIRGFKDKERKRDAQIVIYFDEDPVNEQKTIMIITILEPDYILENQGTVEIGEQK